MLTIYTAAIFLSAALLFVIQPLFAKMVLPKLSGSPAVWSIAMVFFQAVLLAGYTYAHLVMRVLPGRVFVILHMAIMIAAAFALPLSVAAGWGRPPIEGQAVWLLGLFAASIGLPFFALSADGPMLQAWFARTNHNAAKDPYFLYAASNAGSFLALLAYPLVIEPFSGLDQQTATWAAGFLLLIALVGVCGAMIPRVSDISLAPTPDTVGSPRLRDVATWLALTAVPSGLLIATTSHISTDVAASPFLWVIPLALYLATFVLVFQGRGPSWHRWMTLVQPSAVILLVAWLSIEPIDEIVTALAVNLFGFFIVTMVCHGELARSRPPARYLTAFYLWISAGGMIGGIFAGLLALYMFSWVAEFPLLIFLACLCRPGLLRPTRPDDALFFTIVITAGAVMLMLSQGWRVELSETAFRLFVAAGLVLGFVFQRDALKFATLIGLALVFTVLFEADKGPREFVRSFFGVHKVVETDNGQFRVLMNGVTEHGAQRIRDAFGQPVNSRPEPLTYYHEASPLVEGIAAMRARRNAPIRVAIIGLGTSSLACQAAPEDTFEFYEIDLAVVRIARNPNLFTFLSACAPTANIIIGDARLTLAEVADVKYDILIVDAFSSDAIPTHLLTQEAMMVYAKKIVRDGVILMHVTNRHMVLAPVVAGIARANGFMTRVNESLEGEDFNSHKIGSTVVAAARSDEDFGRLTKSGAWKVIDPDPYDWIWTDNYSNVLGTVLHRFRQ